MPAHLFDKGVVRVWFFAESTGIVPWWSHVLVCGNQTEGREGSAEDGSMVATLA